jgi:hypothetical protein
MMSTPCPAELHARVTALPLPAGRVLRIARIDGELRIADGFTGDDVLRALASGVRVPVGAWPAMAAAVAALLEGDA